ncbi:MAG: aldose 1-epimerase [Candidatus Latescibacteria bacterium]|nr:aldose 1-epimerase [Candidatus Latescibacterota bacterium]
MSDRHTVREDRLEGQVIYVLRDEATRAEAKVLPTVGANCFAYAVEIAGRRIEVLESPPDLQTLAERASGFGFPILFPFPNRVRAGRFTFEGKTYQMDAAFGGNAIHGFVHTRPWKVAASRTTDGASLTLRFDSADHPDVVRQFPFPFRAEATYTLQEGALTLSFKGENVGGSSMPAGYGVHPYFRAPLLPDGDPAQCRVQAPVRKIWELKDLLPTGRLTPAEGDFDLRAGKPLAGSKFDAVFTDVVPDPDGLLRCVLTDRGAGVELVVASEGPFREIVVYTPPGRASICFEPYTCTTDAFNLQPQGIDAGLIVLKPGEALTGTVRVIPQKL